MEEIKGSKQHHDDTKKVKRSKLIKPLSKGQIALNYHYHTPHIQEVVRPPTDSHTLGGISESSE